ncbi:hypothetical protein O181_121570 [Austropuccinia psidii MF-1]|uniref:Uncharacterized protein n=1 Tax=Austropuccinia psidii MF-1 TaxID=1389203 RepID=A0A9Q3Q2F9_9BASI|nr:hypothetical protein [Austropuccinia psidii MF-1]
MVIQSHANSKNEEICRCVGIAASWGDNGGVRQRTIYTRIRWFGVREIGWLTRKRGEVDYVRWHAIIHMSWFVALFQDANASHMNPYTCAGSDNAKSSLRLYGLPTLHMQIITLVRAPKNSKNSLRPCRLPMPPTEFLTLCRFPTIQAIPYACAGSDNAKNSLRLCRRPTIHTQILRLVKVPDNAKSSLCLCRLLTVHTPILTLVKVPNNAENVCHCKLPTIHTPILPLVKVPKNAKNSLPCAGFQQFTCQSLHL